MTLLFLQNWTQKGDQDTLRLFLRSMTISYALFFLTVGPGDSWFLPFLLNSHPLQTGEFYCPTSQRLVVPHFLFTIHEGTSCYKCADRYRDMDNWTQDHKRGISQIEKSYKMFTVPFPYCPSEQQWTWKSLSHVRLFVTPWTIQSMDFSRPECWSGLPCPPPGNLPNPGIEPRSPALQADSLPAEPQGKPWVAYPWIFQIQESNRGLLHCRWILYQQSYQGSHLWAAESLFSPHCFNISECFNCDRHSDI